MVVSHSRTFAFACLALLAVVALACQTRDAIMQDYDNIHAYLQEADSMGARVCAPQEYATAEANLEFAMEECAERDYSKARDHLALAYDMVLRAKQMSLNCIEMQPPDTDGDGITDDADACRDLPEDIDGWQDEDGCPDPDNDGDGILDVVDACPNAPETINGIDDEDGCPDMVYERIEITEEEIVLREKIHFETGRATIQIDSNAILDEVVAALQEHPEIRIRIEGHTDSRGSLEYNQRLSQARADSVMEYLTGHGVDASRMMAVGYGPTQPIATNNTERGLAKNRRVEIHIIE